MTKHDAPPSQAPAKGRIRPALAAAIRLIVEEGNTQAQAAQAVGMNAVSLSLALKKPHVVALRSAVKRAWLGSETDKAWLTMAHLASNAASEDVRFKSAKVFLEAAGELERTGDDGSKGPRSLVQIVLHHPASVSSPAGGLPGVVEVVPPGRGGSRYGVVEAG